MRKSRTFRQLNLNNFLYRKKNKVDIQSTDQVVQVIALGTICQYYYSLYYYNYCSSTSITASTATTATITTTTTAAAAAAAAAASFVYTFLESLDSEY